MAGASSRTDGLIRDIAQLFVSYPAEVWKPILDALSEGGQTCERIAETIKSLNAEAAATAVKPSVKRTRKQSRISSSTALKRKKLARRVKPASGPSFSPQRSEILSIIGDALDKKLILPTLPEVRQVYLLCGGKEELPKNRKSAYFLLLHQLDASTDDAFNKALDLLREKALVDEMEPADDSYARWFNIIRPRP